MAKWTRKDDRSKDSNAAKLARADIEDIINIFRDTVAEEGGKEMCGEGADGESRGKIENKRREGTTRSASVCRRRGGDGELE